MDNSEITYRLISAFILSGLIGLERETHGRAAGLRTHILVGIGAALIMLVSIFISQDCAGNFFADPGRVAAGVVTGIGFIGAGTIIRFGASIKGLTTAASLWASAGIGLAAGCGFMDGAFLTTALILFCLVFLGRFENRIIRKNNNKYLEIETSSNANQLQQIKGIISDYDAQINNLEIDESNEPDKIKLKINLKLASDEESGNIVSDIVKIEGVDNAKWIER